MRYQYLRDDGNFVLILDTETGRVRRTPIEEDEIKKAYPVYSGSTATGYFDSNGATLSTRKSIAPAQETRPVDIEGSPTVPDAFREPENASPRVVRHVPAPPHLRGVFEPQGSAGEAKEVRRV